MQNQGDVRYNYLGYDMSKMVVDLDIHHREKST